MHLVAESGSTKTDWRVLHQSDFKWEGVGLNPLVASRDFILQEIKNVSKNPMLKEAITQVSFFGAGCSRGEASDKMEEILRQCFPEAKIRVNSDLLAAAIAVFGQNAGVIGILGTGSNAAYFDGKTLSSKNLAMGYILGDDGAGAGIGRAILRSYLTGALFWENLIKNENLTYNKTQIIQEVYGTERPNTYLGQYAKVALKNQHIAEVYSLLKGEFARFFEGMVVPNLDQHRKLGLVGSIAHYGRELLEEVSVDMNCKIIKIIPQPINHLIQALEIED